MEYNYKFKNKKLFDLAMTHISLANRSSYRKQSAA